MIGTLSRLWNKRQPALATWLDLGSADTVYAIGDIHGRRDLLLAMEARLLRDIEESNFANVVFLYLGDLIDRGPNSAHVLDHILSPPPENVRRVILRGNHEDMFLSFLQRPEGHAAWLDHGGDATLASYGAYIAASDLRRSRSGETKQLIQSSVPERHIAALRNAPHGAVAGEWIFTHAGIEPLRPRVLQTAADVTWGSAGDLTTRSASSGRVVFGHFAGDQIRQIGHTICIDTGAYATGRLSAVRITHRDAGGNFAAFEVGNEQGNQSK